MTHPYNIVWIDDQHEEFLNSLMRQDIQVLKLRHSKPPEAERIIYAKTCMTLMQSFSMRRSLRTVSMRLQT
jgi:hypothetical protein